MSESMPCPSSSARKSVTAPDEEAVMRLRTWTTGAPLDRARRRTSHGTRSEYLSTEVTNTTMSALSMRVSAVARFSTEVESMSGVSTRATSERMGAPPTTT